MWIHALSAGGGGDALAAHLRHAVDDGVPADRLREILLQSALFGGFPRALEAFEVFARIAPDAPPGVPGIAPDRERGERLFGKVYGDRQRLVQERLHAFHPALERVILESAYGSILAREPLDLRVRELAAVGALALLRTRRQLASHVCGAARVGAAPHAIREAIRQMEVYAPRAAIDEALEVASLRLESRD